MAVVLLLGAAGQIALEAARASGGRPPLLAGLALLGSAVLAALAFRHSNAPPGPPEPLELPGFPRSLYAWTLPGGFLLIVALVVHVAHPGDPRAAAAWVTGIALILLPGAVDWWRRRRTRGRRAWILWAAAAFLFVFAFSIRTWRGIDRIPAFVDHDESLTGIAARESWSQGGGGLFGFWDMGNPRMTVFVSALAARPFGEGLRGLRLGSALLSSLSVVLLFDFGRRLIGTGPAFLAAVLLAVNHSYLHWGRVGQIYVDTPFFASLVLALFLRSLTGGSFLALTGAAVALGIGASTYVATEVLPFVVALVFVGWAMTFHWPRRRVLAVLGFCALVALLTCAPMAATVVRISPEIAYQRVPSISLLQPDGLAQLTRAYGAASSREAVVEHVVRTLSIFNFGSDHFAAYLADRGLADAVTAALLPAAYAVALAMLSAPVAWASVVFTGAYLTGAVLLTASPPTYHRISVVLLFSSLAVAWLVVGMGRVIAARLRAPLVVPALAVAVAGASAFLNLHYYFAGFPRTTSSDAGFVLGNLICRYAPTHTIVDATKLDRNEYVSTFNRYPDFECPEAKRVRIESSEKLWDLVELTSAPRVVLIVPTAVEAGHPGSPGGYRLARRSVDASIRLPAPMPLTVLEYETTAVNPPAVSRN